MGIQVNQDLLVDEAEQDQAKAPLPQGVYPVGQELPPDRVKLFEVNDRQYTGPKRVDHRVVFRYLQALRRGADDAHALADLLGDTLGDPIIDVLATEELSPEEFETVMRVVEKHVLGATNQSLGNSNSGRSR